MPALAPSLRVSAHASPAFFLHLLLSWLQQLNMKLRSNDLLKVAMSELLQMSHMYKILNFFLIESTYKKVPPRPPFTIVLHKA